MPAKVYDIVSANLVLVGIRLLDAPAEFEQFAEALDTDLQAELGISANAGGMPEPTRKITLNRDRITLTMSPSRTSLDKEYPSRENPTGDFARLAEVAQCAIASTILESERPAAFGYNLEAVFDQDSGQPALHYLGNRLFGPYSPGKAGWSLIGGTGQLILADSRNRQWTISARPRANDEREHRVVLGLNLHIREQRLPTAAEIQAALVEVWHEANDFMEQLDRQG